MTDAIKKTFADARALIADPARFCTGFYGLDAQAEPRADISPHWHSCGEIKQNLEQAGMPHSMCLVTAIIAAAPDANTARETLNAAVNGIKTHITDDCVLVDNVTHAVLERFNNHERVGHSGVLHFLEVLSQ